MGGRPPARTPSATSSYAEACLVAAFFSLFMTNPPPGDSEVAMEATHRQQHRWPWGPPGSALGRHQQQQSPTRLWDEQGQGKELLAIPWAISPISAAHPPLALPTNTLSMMGTRSWVCF